MLVGFHHGLEYCSPYESIVESLIEKINTLELTEIGSEALNCVAIIDDLPFLDDCTCVSDARNTFW